MTDSLKAESTRPQAQSLNVTRIFNRRNLWILFISAIVIRVVSLGLYPLMDTTEARYGEMARLMVETGNWLTPQFDYGIPFWGKPPLFNWMSAIGIEVFGVNEFAVRVPHWLVGIFTLGCVAYLAKQIKVDPLVSTLVLATSAIFSISAGAVMTDMALTFGMTVAMIGFYLCWRDNSSREQSNNVWGYVGFVGLAIGLLSKGPVSIVIFGLAVFPWMVLQHGLVGAFTQLWCRFPIVKGTLLMLAIALPWYIMAEQATPGFIDYFIVGEHFKRFLVSGWEGDLYGSAHDEARGTIWLFWLSSAAPWSIVLPILFVRSGKNLKSIARQYNGAFSLAFCWLIAPMILFTFAGNILPAYVLPGVPALGILIAILLKESDEKWFKGVAWVVPVLLVGAVVFLNLGKADTRSDRSIFENIGTDTPSFYIGKRPFSGQFYSSGKAKKLEDMEQPIALNNFYLIGKREEVVEYIQKHNLDCRLEFKSKTKRKAYLCGDNIIAQQTFETDSVTN